MPNFNSSSVLENGWPVLVVDVEDLVRSIDNLLSGRRLGKLTAQEVERRFAHQSGSSSSTIQSRSATGKAAAGKPRIHGRCCDRWRRRLERGPERHYDLVVSDIDMPRMDGIQLVQHIKDDARLKAIPVVIVSYKDREGRPDQGAHAGANYYLTKSSFHDKTFLTTVADLIGEPRRIQLNQR